MRQPRLALFAVTAALALSSAPAFAKSEGLWSERPSGAAPLAQVPDFRTLAKNLSPAVVSIQVEQKANIVQGRGPGRAEGFDLHRFFGQMPQQPRQGQGSGFVIGSQGLILTNNHVIEDADRIEVTFELDGGKKRTLQARVLGTAPQFDVALIETTENANAPIAYLGDSDQLDIGDWVMAIGNPFGLSHSVSVGIVSAKGRRNIEPSGRQGLYDFIQTDASINPGNSGGPLINMRGEVIGINAAINAAGAGIGFAIPINMVKTLLPELKTKGKFSRSWIGIRIQPLTPELAKSYGLNNPQGALVSEVVPKGPAEKAGIQDGDVIVTFDGKSVVDSSDLPLFASMAGVGKKVAVELVREGKRRTQMMVLEAFPEDSVALASEKGEAGGELGLTVSDITPQLQEQLRLETSRGVVVKELERGGAADRAGLQVGDVVLSLNNNAISTAREFATQVRAAKKGAILRLQVLRSGGRLFLAFPKP